MMGSSQSQNPRENLVEGDFAEDGQVKPLLLEDGRYKNPFDTWVEPRFGNVLKFLTGTKDLSKIPWGKEDELSKELPVRFPDFERLKNPPRDKVQLMWVGHASVLVQFDGISLLTDPIWGNRCGPLGIMGPSRYRPPPCKIEELPTLDAVVISHNHYDHLDHESVVKLNRKFGDKLTWFVAMGQADWMRANGCQKVVELTWWQEHKLEKDGKSFTFAATPAQHWCKRSLTDTNKALWCSWVVKGPKHSFYFAGDTGYCCAFKQIGRKYGPFSLSAIPIGAYHPRWFMKPQHCDPDEAVTIHTDLRSERSVGIHWGTFRMTYEYYMEPKLRIAEILQDRGMDPKCFFTVNHGDVTTIDSEHKNDS